LTNDAVQKDMPHYGTFEVNNKMSMEELQAALGDQVNPSKMHQLLRYLYFLNNNQVSLI
jgi:hypothetical protein